MMQTENLKIIHLKMSLDRDNSDRFFSAFNPVSDHLRCKCVTGTRLGSGSRRTRRHRAVLIACDPVSLCAPQSALKREMTDS